MLRKSIYRYTNTRSRRRLARRRAGAFVGLCAALAVALGAGAATAGAAPAPVAPQQVQSWALTPTGTNPNEPGARPNFSYTLAGGGSVTDSLTVWNYSNVQLTFHVYATDAFNTASDGFDLIPGSQKPKDVGSWIHINQNFLTLPASSKASIGFTVRVPANATPGDHAGGIVAASETGLSGSSGIALDRRTGTRVYLRVSGAVTPALVVEHLSSTYHASINSLGGTLDVVYRVRNNGNVRLGAHQSLTVRDVFGKVATRKPADLPDLLPGNAVTVTEHLTGVAATLRVSSKVTLTPFVPKDSGQAVPAKLHSSTASASAWAIPWTVLLVLLALGIVIFFLRRRQRRAPAPTGPAVPPAPTPASVPAGAASGAST